MGKDLIYIPNEHQAYESHYATRVSRRSQIRVNHPSVQQSVQFWRTIEQKIEHLRATLNPSRIDIFYEGVHLQEDIRMFTSRADYFLENFDGAHSFIAHAIKKLGATLRITENGAALKICDIAIDRQLRMINANAKLIPAMYKEIVLNRDKHIAANLNKCVPEEGFCILVMGAGHDVPSHLDESWNIHVMTLPDVAARMEEMVVAKASPPLRWLELYKAQN